MVIILRIWIEYRSCFLTFKIRLMYHLDTSNQKKYTQGKIEICRLWNYLFLRFRLTAPVVVVHKARKLLTCREIETSTLNLFLCTADFRKNKH